MERWAEREKKKNDGREIDKESEEAKALDPEIDALVSARTEARASKDFAEADRIRDELTARGIVVEDTPNGPVWHRG